MESTFARIASRLALNEIVTFGKNLRALPETVSDANIFDCAAMAGVALLPAEERAIRTAFSNARANSKSISRTQVVAALRNLSDRRSLIIADTWRRLGGTDHIVAGQQLACATHRTSRPQAIEVETAFLKDYPAGQDVTKEEFCDWCAFYGRRFTGDDQFAAALAFAWQRCRCTESADAGETGWVTSAYHQVRGDFAPDLRPPAGDEFVPRLVEMTQTSIEPFPYRNQQPRVPRYSMASPNNDRTKNFAGGEEVAGAYNPQLTLPERSLAGVVRTGMRDSRGFLDVRSTAHDLQGEFCDEAMNVYAADHEAQLQHIAEQHRLRTTPWETKEPECLPTSTDYWKFQQGRPRSPVRTAKSDHKTMKNSGNGVPVSAEDLQQVRADSRMKSLPRGWRRGLPFDGISTMRDHFAPYDQAKAAEMNERYATIPLPHRNAPQGRVAPKGPSLGVDTSEYRDRYVDRSVEGDPVNVFGAKGHFILRHGVRLMSSKVHHPLNIVTGQEYTPSGIVPGQFIPMSVQLPHVRSSQ